MDIEPRGIKKPELPPLPVPTQEEPGQEKYPESLHRIFRNRHNLEWEIQQGFRGGSAPRRRGYRLALWSAVAALIDLLLLLGMSCLFLLVFLKIVHAPMTRILIQDFAFIFVLGSWMYMTVTRFFIGASLGEASCDIRLGCPQDRMKPTYFAKVVLRTTLVVATGVLPLPLLSTLLGRDLAGTLSGLRLFSLK